MVLICNRSSLTALLLFLTVTWFVPGCSDDATPPADPQGSGSSTTSADSGSTDPAAKPAAEDDKLYPPGEQTEKPFVLEMSPEIKMEFAWIPPGDFMMGNETNGLPRHKESVEPFYMGIHEVTQEQWELVMGTNPSLNRGKKYPVERVNWPDVVKFVDKMNAKYGSSGMKFGVPTEAQWEYACRGGRMLRVGSSDDKDRIGEYAWMGGNAKSEPHPVGEKKANDWGLYDMQGNIAEFCSDIVKGEGDGVGENWRVVRGGNFRGGDSECLSTSRFPRREVVPLRQDGLRLMCVKGN